MEKKPESKRTGQGPAKSKPARPKSPTIAALQKLDCELIQLCIRRAELFGELCQAGKIDPAKQFDGASDVWPTDVDDDRVRPLLNHVYREVQSFSAALVNPIRVAYLGPEYSYSHLATIERFGQSAELLAVSSIPAVFESVKRGDTEYGVVPIENSTDGRIVDTLDMFVRMPVNICGEIPMRIHHNLLGIGKLSEVQEVHSKPQALSQCRGWISKNLRRAKLVAADSTTAAAEEAKRNSHVAAIASRQAGANYQLQLLAKNIEDNKDNVTRFAVIGSASPKPSGNDKLSIMFELLHQPGALADAMAVFKRCRLNLTWIESFPKKGSPSEYIFFVELEGHQADARVRRAIDGLTKKTARIELLGSYPKAEPVG
ncbi:MAG: prephenate dehydratase [Pirellulaceae bacterium]